jgi:hypothetical protein
MDFKIDIVLPSGRTLKVKELSNKIHFTILKYCAANDFKGLAETLNSYIEFDCSHNIIDRFYTILYIRSVFINQNIPITSKNLGHSDYDINIILKRIVEIYDDLSTTVKCDSNIELTLGLPAITYFDDIDDLFRCVIKQIKIKDDSIQFESLSISDQETILSILPGNVFKILSQYVDSITDVFNSFVFIEEVKEYDIEEFKINLLSNGIIGIIANLFNTGLQNFYSTMHSVCTKMNYSSELFFSITPIETRILINLYNTDIEEQNKQLQKQ